VNARTRIEVGLLTGGQDRSYVVGLTGALASKSVRMEVIGSDEVDTPEMHATANLRFLNLRGSVARNVGRGEKVRRVVRYYARLVRYAFTATPRVFHILWNNKFEYFDRTILMLYYRLLGKRVVLTTHNVNAARRDARDTALNRLTLKVQYRLADRIFVHTAPMRDELIAEFGVNPAAVTVIPFGINTTVPDTDLTPDQAKRLLGIAAGEKTILFFGRIGPYKGLEYLVDAFQRLAAASPAYRLVIAGELKDGSDKYFADIRQRIDGDPSRARIVEQIGFVPDADTELYFKAADVLVLPYTEIFQSGVLFLAYGFGLPVVASDVGAFREDIVEGRTGFLCKPRDPADLAKAIDTYFDSELFAELMDRRQEIRDFAHARHSWDVVGDITRQTYADLLDCRA
jgi:D-inositol-3-phosphate glycosyltransferase